MTGERIALISDCEGNVGALGAALRSIKQDAPYFIVVAGDILASPFSPDPPSETIALLRSESVQVIPGNTDRYLLDWGTPRWPLVARAAGEWTSLRTTLCRRVPSVSGTRRCPLRLGASSLIPT